MIKPSMMNMVTTDGEKIFNTQELAEALDMGCSTVSEYLRNGTINGGQKFEGNWYVKQTDVDAYISKMEKSEATRHSELQSMFS